VSPDESVAGPHNLCYVKSRLPFDPPPFVLYKDLAKPPIHTNAEDGNCIAYRNGKPSTFYVAYSLKPKLFIKI
jgi:hypothetical protein